MHYTKIALVLLCSIIIGCGKSPLFNKLEKNTSEISGNILLSEEFPNQKISFKVLWSILPSLNEMSEFEIDLASPLKINQTINAFIWMPEMGHGSSPFTKMQPDDQHFVFSEVAFIMPGRWVLHIEIIENNIIVDQWQKSIVL